MKQDLVNLVHYIEREKNFILSTDEGLKKTPTYNLFIYTVCDKSFSWDLDKEEFTNLVKFFKSFSNWKIKTYTSEYSYSTKYVGIDQKATDEEIRALKKGYYCSYNLFLEETKAADKARAESRNA